MWPESVSPLIKSLSASYHCWDHQASGRDSEVQILGWNIEIFPDQKENPKRQRMYDLRYTWTCCETWGWIFLPGWLLLEELENTLVLFSAIVTLLAAVAFTLIFLPKSPDEQKPTKHTRRIESKMIQRVLRSFESRLKRFSKGLRSFESFESSCECCCRVGTRFAWGAKPLLGVEEEVEDALTDWQQG